MKYLSLLLFCEKCIKIRQFTMFSVCELQIINYYVGLMGKNQYIKFFQSFYYFFPLDIFDNIILLFH